MTSAEKTRRTYQCEVIRAVSAGVVETSNTTFLVLIAIQWFHASATLKGLIVSGISVGFLLTPFLVRFLSGRSIQAARFATGVSVIGGIAFLVAAMVPTLEAFTAASVVALACYSLNTPISAHIYQENYPLTQRGRLFSRTIAVRILSGLLFSSCVGWALTGRLFLFQYVLGAFSVSLFVSAWCFWNIPSSSLPPPERKSFWGAFEYVGSDAIFRQTLICWMFLGFGTLMMAPLRVQFLVAENGGFQLSELEVSLIVSILPSVGRFVFSPIWGRLFDKMNFFVMRAAANACFIVSILSFFSSTTMTGLVLGALVFGVANAGGEIAWNLWVTKLAPADRTADYMSVHTFLTGVRGVVAPLVAFHLADHYAMSSILWVSIVLLVISILIILPSAKSLGSGMESRRAGNE